MFIIERFSEKYKYDYFAIQYLVKITTDKTNKKHEELVDCGQPFWIRKCNENENGKKEIKCVEEKTYAERLMILPKLLRHDEEERDVLNISASSGSGKSYFVNLFSKIYNTYYPKNKIYFITLNDFKKDKSLTHELYSEINMNEFINAMEHEQEAFAKTGSIMENSLIIFDDIGTLANDRKREKIVWTFINTVLENKRKSKISIAIISHVPTNYRLTSVLVRETEWYIIFPSNQQVKSDRFLNSYLGLSKKQVHRITEEEDVSRWIAINTKRKIVVTQFKVYSLKANSVE